MKNTLRTMFSSNSQQPEARCHVLLREATFFLDKLKSEESHLRDMERSACATLAESARVMDSPLPRLVFESGEQRTVETIGGVEFQGQTVERAKLELARKLQTEVFDPLALWVSSYNAALGQQKMIDKLRIERDLQGRKVNKLRGKVEKMHTRNGNKTSHKLEKIIKKLQNHEGQLMVASNRHDEEEEAQYARLRLLIQDAAFMRPYVKRALQQVAMALQEASSALPDGPFTLGTIPETGPPVEAPPITPTADGSALAPLRLKSVGMPVQPMVTTQLSEANAAAISNIQVGSAVVDGPQIVSGSATPRAESPRAAIVRANPTYDSPRSQSPYLRSPLGAAAPSVASPVPGTTPGSIKEHEAHSNSNGSVESLPSVPATALPSPPNKMTRFVEGESAPSPQVQRVQVQDVPHPMTP